MRKVVLDAVVHGVSPGDVFENVASWERYQELAPHAESVVVHRGRPEPTGSSSWELHFRSGLLQWSEDERFLTDQLRIEFEQTEGDFDVFTGTWTLAVDGGNPADTAVRFVCDFDFGIPSLEGILDPIAERVIKETVAWAIAGMHEKVTFGGGLDLTPANVGGAEAAVPATA
ncbi:type II toxin-antitoxin system RatA family toxin [Parafrankia sp. FMc2]|uniref:type II toxin-antitoxin system RatA family toxin n=1 Tax=Parafrankia sp. FMc2 TaxID=3233196 RepID=UPI0034D54FE9|nr:SRPBCC family protein [Frankia sp. Cpl3]